jgi:iron complex outermembrane receptor protein
MPNRSTSGSILLTIFFGAASLAFGADPALPADFGNLSLDQLANIKVTSFTRKQQELSHVAGAVYVITKEQIARSGLTTLPELLRLAPGIDVAQVNRNQWSVSARGTVGIFSNKLLVLIDGRSIYSPVFAGVYWDLGMPLLDDIERIEVIRGPGATIWGANAVLGVINIITRSSRDTHGTTITSGGGSSERAFGSASVGGAIGSTSYRGYFGGTDDAAASTSSGGNAHDGWGSMQGGFRLDGSPEGGSGKKNTWMLEGDLFRAVENDVGMTPSIAAQGVLAFPSRFDSTAANITGEWSHRLNDKSEFRIQSYYDYVDRPQPEAPTVETSTGDLEFQYFTRRSIHNLSAGGGARVISERIDAVGSLAFSPSRATYANFNGFVQDEMHFAHDALLLTVGAKLEHNHFGGWGPEPSANLLWAPNKHQSLWISAARSLRTPTLFEQGVHAPFAYEPASPATGGLPVLAEITGSPAFSTEALNDYEAGYRVQVSKRLSADLAVFYDQYSNIRSYASSYPALMFSPAPYLDVTEQEGNAAAAVGKGAESSVAFEVSPRWKLEGSYTYNIVDAFLSSSAPPGSINAGGKEPSHNKWRLQSYVNLSKSWQLDTFLYLTSQASPTNSFGPELLVPSYTRLDVRLGYRPRSHWRLSLAGQNLLQARHLEAISEILTGYSYVRREVYLKSTWQF